MNRVAAGGRAVWLQRRMSVSSPGIEPGLRPSRSRVRSGTLRGQFVFRLSGTPPRNRKSVLQNRSLPCCPAHSQGKYLDQESNLDLNLRRVLCDPLHHRDERQPWDRHPACLRCVPGWKPIPHQRPDPESNRDQDLRRVLCVPLHHRDDSRSEPTTGLAPVSSGLQDRRLAVRATSAVGLPARRPGARFSIKNPVSRSSTLR